MNVSNNKQSLNARPSRSSVRCRPTMHFAFRNDCARILNDLTTDGDAHCCRLQRQSTSETRSSNMNASVSPAFFSTKFEPPDVRLEKKKRIKGKQSTNLKRNNQTVCSCKNSPTLTDVSRYSVIICLTKSLANALRAADLNHLAVDVETVVKRLASGKKTKLDVAASNISNPAGEHSKTTTLSPDRCSSKRLEVDEESVCSCKHALLPSANQFNTCDSCLTCVSSQFIHRGVQTGEALIKSPLTSSVDAATQHTSRDISSESSGNCNCALRSVTPDCNRHASENAKGADTAKTGSPMEGDSLSGPYVGAIDEKSVSKTPCYLPHASTNSNALVEEDFEKVATSQSKLFHQSSTSSPNSKSPNLVVDIDDRERPTQRNDAKTDYLETACRTCRFQLRTISLQLCRRQMEFEVQRTEWDKRQKLLQEELAKLRSQTEQLARENEDMQRKLADKEAEISQIAQALHLVREKLSLQQPLVAPTHPNQDHPMAGEEFLGLLRSLVVKHSLGAFTDVSPGTHQAALSSGHAAAMSPRSFSVVSDVSMSCESSKAAPADSAAPVIAVASREPTFGGMKTNNDTKANSTNSENADDLETNGELDRDSISDVCPAARRYRRPPSAPLARTDTPLGSLYSSVSSLRTVDEVQFRTGLSSLDAQIAKLRLSLCSQ